jgi:hypothetical protein
MDDIKYNLSDEQNKSLRLLKESLEQLKETEEIANSTKDELRRQSDVIKKTKGNSKKINVKLNRSKGLLYNFFKLMP